MALKDYNKQNWPKADQTKFKASGVKSPNSDSEMLLVVPLEAHPQIRGFYKAIDPNDNWEGWVEYELEAEPVSPKKEKKIAIDKLTFEIAEKQKLIDLKVFTPEETNIEQLRSDLKLLINS